MEGHEDMPQMETLPARTWTPAAPAPEPLTRTEAVAAIRETIRVDGLETLPLLRLDYTMPGERFDVSGVRDGWVVAADDESLTFEDTDGECATLDWSSVNDLRPVDYAL